MARQETRVSKLERKLGGRNMPEVVYIHVTEDGGIWYDRPLSDPDKRELNARERELIAEADPLIKVKYVDDWGNQKG